MKVYAQDVSSLFGAVTPPANFGGGDPLLTFGNLISFGVFLFIIVAFGVGFVYTLLGAFEWITSGGEKDKLTKAQQKVTNALIGIILVIVMLTVFTVVNGTILGGKIVEITPDGKWMFKLPIFQNSP